MKDVSITKTLEQLVNEFHLATLITVDNHNDRDAFDKHESNRRQFVKEIKEYFSPSPKTGKCCPKCEVSEVAGLAWACNNLHCDCHTPKPEVKNCKCGRTVAEPYSSIVCSNFPHCENNEVKSPTDSGDDVVEEIVMEFENYSNDTNWQRMDGAELVDIVPANWLRKALTSFRDKIREEAYNAGQNDQPWMIKAYFQGKQEGRAEVLVTLEEKINYERNVTRYMDEYNFKMITRFIAELKKEV